MTTLLFAVAAMNFGAWNVEFDEADSRLKVANPSAKVELAGELAFESNVETHPSEGLLRITVTAPKTADMTVSVRL